ncbi:MAG: DUF2155 domain-containing protein [Sphingomonas sp.]|nr:MAG: DUF2155 domain-containing protein [Sphingomonas sp.]
MTVKHLSAALLVAIPAALAAQPAAEKAAPAKPAPRAATTATRPAAPAPTDRTAVIGVLDKRLGTTAEFTLKPGERFSFGRIAGILQTCDKTQPFERPQSAAFVQVAETPAPVQGKPQGAAKSIFSGWLFAESPSLNPFVHPVYDVWLKSCTMRFPDGPKAPSSSTGNSSGKKSGSAAKPAPAKPEAPAAPATPAPATTPEA